MNPNEQHDRPRNTRRYQRYEIETEMIAAVFGTERRELRGRSLNINEGGIGGVFAKGMDVGCSVNLQFSVPVVPTPVRVHGIVRILCSALSICQATIESLPSAEQSV